MNIGLGFVIEYIGICIPETMAALLLFYGIIRQKFRFDFRTIVYMIVVGFVDVISAFIYNRYQLDILNYAMYILLYIYIYLVLRKAVKSIQITISVNIIEIFIELFFILWVEILRKYIINVSQVPAYFNIIGSVFTLCTAYCLYKKNKFISIFNNVFDENKILGNVTIIAGAFYFIPVIVVRIRNILSTANLVLFVCFSIMAIVILYQWNKAIDMGREKDRRIMLQKMCQESYEQLMVEVRSRQHEFANHLAALQGMHYSCKDMDELSRMQSRYCERIIMENKYNKLLYGCNNPAIGGFLYSKFSKSEEKGVNTQYTVSFNLKDSLIDEFQIIEIVGILYDNAIEALEKYNYKCKQVKVKIVQENDELSILVGNRSPFFTSEQIVSFFKYGYTSKGIGRGIGLAKIKKIVEDSNGRIITRNSNISDENWFEIELHLPCHKAKKDS